MRRHTCKVMARGKLVVFEGLLHLPSPSTETGKEASRTLLCNVLLTMGMHGPLGLDLPLKRVRLTEDRV